MSGILWRVMGLGALLALCLPVSAQMEKPPAVEAVTKETMNVRTRNGRQMDVWIDGRRIGLTPLKLQLAPGTYFLTAGSDGVEPVLRKLEVLAGGEQVAVLNDLPLVSERLPAVIQEIMGGFREYPDNPHVRILAALLTTDRTDHQRLLASLPQDLQRDATVLLSKARWALTDNKPVEALQFIEEALHRESQMAGLWRMKAWTLIELGRMEDATKAAEMAVRLEPMHADSFVARGDVYRAAGEPEFARLNYERALELQPGHELALRGLAGVGRRAEAPR